MKLINFLNTRYRMAEAFTKEFHNQVKTNLEDFDPGDGYKRLGAKKGAHNKHLSDSNFELKIPYIFGTHESMLASIFENMPDLLIGGRIGADSNKAAILKAWYSYLFDKLDLDEFMTNSAWWLILTGMCIGSFDYKIELKDEVPQLDNNDEPMIDENGESINVPTYKYHDPIVTVNDPSKVYFSPESEFSVAGDKVPYHFTTKLVDCDEVEEKYDKKVQPDEKLEVEGFLEKKKGEDSDLDRCKVYYYCGTVPKKYKSMFEKEAELEYEYNKEYKIHHTKDKILHAEEMNVKNYRFARMYKRQDKFFGFGIGKTLKPFQDDMSIRRGQQIRYADLYAFPWLMTHADTVVDQNALMDRYKRKPLVVGGDKTPSYLVPPTMPQTITQADDITRSDAQFVSGTLDISKGAQQTNTVKTATGQQMFAQSQDKRLAKVRKSLAKYYREIVIGIFEISRENWDDEREIEYPDENNEYQTLTITREDLESIDFDTDIDFNLDTVSVNKDIMSQRWLGLLEQSAALPFANQEKIFEKVLRESFTIPNPENYIKTPEEMQEPPAPEAGMPPGVPPMPGEAPPVPQPETMPQPQTDGQQLAPGGQNAGGFGI